MKNIKIILTAILTVSLLQLVKAQQFPDDVQYQSIAPPVTPTFPSYGESVIDNSVSNPIEITRVTELVNYVDGNGDPQIWYPTHEYSKTQVWNTDQTRYKIASWKVYNTTTYQEIHQLVDMDPSYWSNTDPDLMWSFRENGDVKKHVISTNSTQVVANIPGYEVVKLGPGEGNMDKNDHYVALVGKKTNGDLDVIIFNLQTLQIDYTKTFAGAWGNGNTSSPDFIDWVSVSQSGDYVVINWRNALNQINNYYLDQAGVNHYGVEVYNRADMVFQNRIIPYGNHGDLGYAIDGDEVYVQFYGEYGGGKIYMHKLNGSASSIVLNTHSDFGVSGHISCRNINRPGWAYVTMSELNESAQIVAVKLDSSGLTEHFGHHFSSALSYDQAAMAVSSPNGDKICFKSDFGTDPIGGSEVAYSFFANVTTPLFIQGEYLNKINIYPNPANNFMKIKSIKNIKDIIIYNVTGQKIKNFQVEDSNTNTINVNNINNGFYYLQITTEKEKIIKKVIIQ
ncbi:MAG: T9SS type A sorting domain-containing protein [Flavobacteriaceae bacterium]|nr:T9SS type A sorting domain-containing protein [Flavobacteriaceae bacterium]